MPFLQYKLMAISTVTLYMSKSHGLIELSKILVTELLSLGWVHP